MNMTALTNRARIQAVIVSSDEQTIQQLADLLRQELPQASLSVFENATAALGFLQLHTCHILFLDVRSGGAFAAQFQSACPQCNLIFLADSNRYALLAFDLHASGYLTVPLTRSALSRELADLRHPVPRVVLHVQCRGPFEVFLLDGQPVQFRRSKSKELFAYLIYRRGSSCTAREMAAALFGDAPYDQKTCRYLQRISSTLMADLRRVGAAEVISKHYNYMAVKTELLDCDWDAPLTGPARGTPGIMEPYPWAGPDG